MLEIWLANHCLQVIIGLFSPPTKNTGKFFIYENNDGKEINIK